MRLKDMCDKSVDVLFERVMPPKVARWVLVTAVPAAISLGVTQYKAEQVKSYFPILRDTNVILQFDKSTNNLYLQITNLSAYNLPAR